MLLNAATLALVAALGSACSSNEGSGDSQDGGTVTVLAAASLTETFTTLADIFEADHPGVTVRLAFDSSATLAGQAAQGAPADVLATADLATMQQAQDAGVVTGTPERFATNTLTLVVPRDNPADLADFGDLSTPGVDYVACVETAPCGAASAALLTTNEITAAPASLETDVKAVLAKVVQDEADAGLVYRSDAVAAGEGVQALEIPGADGEVLAYPVAILRQAQQPDLAAEFVELLLSPEGQSTLAAAGFGPP
ncbi:molybdate ABC transporter substrate-binding protein [Nocardioides salsibiostraticola]